MNNAVAVRFVRQSNFLHGKMCLTEDGGVVGSSNFTKNGLGGSDRPNLEVNLQDVQSRHFSVVPKRKSAVLEPIRLQPL